MAIFNSKLLVYQRLIYNEQWSWYISSNKKSPLRTPNCGRKRPIWLSGSPGQGPWATFRWGSDRHWWWETENHGDGENLGPMDPHMLVSFDLNLFLLRDIVIHLEWDPNYEPMEPRDIGMPHVCLSENGACPAQIDWLISIFPWTTDRKLGYSNHFSGKPSGDVSLEWLVSLAGQVLRPFQTLSELGMSSSGCQPGQWKYCAWLRNPASPKGWLKPYV